ncbi:MAG: MBL fold metallo-hydrolase [Anaerolineae bacterium]|nr:MBL fold metallo-hydrolase [Anaerolineae bacterium]
MLLQYFYDNQLAQASYLVGCPGSGTAVVIDPSRNIAPYLEAAAENGFEIVYVTETHIHADFVSGIRELAHATDATMLLSGEGGADWSYQFPEGDKIQLVHEGDTFEIGAVKFEVLHTPGHTPESISFMVTDTDASEPMGVFTGDFLFVGDVGRPDLLEEAAGIMGTREVGAKQQFANVQRFQQLADYLQIWPGHGAGSACGKALGAIPSTTLGYEKRFNPAFNIDNEEDFVAWLLDGQPEAPKYFARMKYVNKVGSPLLRELPQAQHIKEQPGEDIVPSDALLIDTRLIEDFAAKHIPGTINIPISSSNFPTYVGWYVDYEKPLFFIAYRNDVMAVLRALYSIGIDNIAGYFTHEAISHHAKGRVEQQSPQEIYESGIKILDVRSSNEYHSEHIPGVIHIHMGKVGQHLDEIPDNEPLAIQCGGGLRSQVVASILQKQGFKNLINMSGGIDEWKKSKLPLEQN